MYKYGIRVLRSVGEARKIDEENGETKWIDVIQPNMNNLQVSCEVYEGDTTNFKAINKLPNTWFLM